LKLNPLTQNRFGTPSILVKHQKKRKSVASANPFDCLAIVFLVDT
jgi:hypothetical protein